MFDWTPGEVLEYIDITNERKRREAQQEAVIFFSTIAANSRVMAGETLHVEECFPFWTEEETAEIRKERLKAKARSMREAMRANMDTPEE